MNDEHRESILDRALESALAPTGAQGLTRDELAAVGRAVIEDPGFAAEFAAARRFLLDLGADLAQLESREQAPDLSRRIMASLPAAAPPRASAASQAGGRIGIGLIAILIGIGAVAGTLGSQYLASVGPLASGALSGLLDGLAPLGDAATSWIALGGNLLWIAFAGVAAAAIGTNLWIASRAAREARWTKSA